MYEDEKHHFISIEEIILFIIKLILFRSNSIMNMMTCIHATTLIKEIFLTKCSLYINNKAAAFPYENYITVAACLFCHTRLIEQTIIQLW